MNLHIARDEKANTFERKGDLVTSAEGKRLQHKIWTEILDVLGGYIPSDSMANLQSGGH